MERKRSHFHGSSLQKVPVCCLGGGIEMLTKEQNKQEDDKGKYRRWIVGKNHPCTKTPIHSANSSTFRDILSLYLLQRDKALSFFSILKRRAPSWGIRDSLEALLHVTNPRSPVISPQLSAAVRENNSASPNAPNAA